MAALSVLSMEREGSRAEVIGEVSESNARWFGSLLRELQGDVTLDCSHAAFVDSAALMLLVDFEQFLKRRGNRLIVDGVPGGGTSEPASEQARLQQ
jgi:anti-anti-sigma regulatory factor